MSLGFLQNTGLSQSEGHIYELLLKRGEIPVSLVIKESGLKRPTVYKILYSLEAKGLVTLKDLKKVLHARPASPAKLLEIVEKPYKDLEKTRTDLLAFLPALTSMYINSTEQPVVRTYEGVDGLKEIYEDLLADGQPICALVQAADVDPELYEWLTTKFVKRRKHAKIHVKAIVASSKESKLYKEKDIEEYRTSVMVPSNSFPFQHGVEIYGDKVAFIHYKKDEPLLGIIIHHPQIAKTCRAWFQLAWLGAQGKSWN